MMDGGDAFFADELILAAVDGKTKFSSADTQTGNYGQAWLSERILDNRTSLIIDPPDGRIPAAGAGAAERRARRPRARRGAARRRRAGPRAEHALRARRHAEPARRLSELLRDHAGAGVVALRTEMIHDTRIFPIDAGAHVSKAITMYHGDSRAAGTATRWWWTRRTSRRTRTSAARPPACTLTEKFKRVSADTIEYYVTWTIPRCGRGRGR
jgi:hypothetical protein